MSRKKGEFKGSDSVDRFQRIQALCANNKLDGVLIIGGVDSSHSQISQALLKYLFLGCSGQELLGDQVISQEHESLEDVILLLGAHRVSIFYSSKSDAAMKILPVIAKWRHVTEYVVHEDMEQDEQEERKIAAFKQMMAGIKCVGIPFGLNHEGSNLHDIMLPEKWPLVQSYGLESGESSEKGFFTMNHRVVNVSCELMKSMAQLDEFSAKRVVLESQPLLAHHFDDFLVQLDHAETPEARTAKSESDLGDNLLNFYEFGTMQYNFRGLKTAPSRGSHVLFGTRTNSLTEKSSPCKFLANSGAKEGVAATHMVVQAEDPLTGIRFTRTYFFSSGRICQSVVDEDALVPSAETPKPNISKAATDTKTMIDLYALLLQGFESGTSKLIQDIMDRNTSSLDQCTEAARVEAIHAMVQMDKTHSQLLSSTTISTQFIDCQLLLTVEFMDACGLPVDQLHEDWSLLYCSLKLSNVPSHADPSVPLGSLIVGDTFLLRHGFSVFKPHDQAAERVLAVTKPFPYFRSWVQGGEEAEAIELLMRTLQSDFMLQSGSVCLGEAITPLEADVATVRDEAQVAISTKAVIVLDTKLMPVVHGNWRVYTGGLVFTSPYFNPIVVSLKRHVTSLTIMPSLYEELVLLKLHLKEDIDSNTTPLSEVLPFPLESQALYIPLLSGARFQDSVFQALEAWKVTASALNIPVYRTSDRREKCDRGISRDHKIDSFEVPAHVKPTCEFLVRKQRFVGQDAHTVDDLFTPAFIPKDPNAATTLPKPNTDDLSKICVPITVMLGIPGSGTKAMALSVCKLSSINFDWFTINVDLRDLDTSKQQNIEASGYLVISDEVAQALDRIKLKVKDLQLPPRIMLSVVGYIDPITVACAIRRATKDRPLPSRIGALINCVSATNVYLPDPLAAQAPFPKLFDQMTAGFVTHIVLTNSGEVTLAILERLRFHMDQVNTFADVMVLPHDVFEGPFTPLLAVDRFDSTYYKQYRNAFFYDWDNTANNGAAPMYTRYVAELERVHAPVSFQFELVPGMDRSKFSSLVAKTLTPFAAMAKSMDRVYPMENKAMKGIRIAQAIAVNKVRQHAYATSVLSRTPCSVNVFSSEQSQSCWCVEGQVGFEDAPGLVYSYLSSGTFARLWSTTDEDRDTPNMVIKFTGLGLNAEKLRELLLNCYAHVEVPSSQVCSKTSVSIDEKREIQQNHAMDPLPEGYLFDGTNYVDFFGNRYEFHPCIPQFIDEYITAANDDRKATKLKATKERESQQCFVRQILL